MSKWSRFRYGGDVMVTPEGHSIWSRRLIPYAEDDIFVDVTPEYANRADLIAHDEYGTAELDWLVLEYNNIIDPVVELVVGVRLRLPSRTRTYASVLT